MQTEEQLALPFVEVVDPQGRPVPGIDLDVVGLEGVVLQVREAFLGRAYEFHAAISSRGRVGLGQETVEPGRDQPRLDARAFGRGELIANPRLDQPA